MHELTNRLTTLDQIFRTKDVLAAGCDEKTIRKMVRSGQWHRLRQGSYCSGELWRALDEDGRRLLVSTAAYRSARSDVVLSHTSAAQRLGAPVWDMPGHTHLTRTDGRAGRREAGVVQHRGVLRAEDVTRRDLAWLTDGTRTALDCTTITDVEHSLVIVNGLLAAGETTLPLLHRRYAAMRHVPDTLRTNLVLRLADARCESAGESRTFYLLWQAGLPKPILQYPVRDAGGKIVARLDFAWPELGVFLEFDGMVKYRDLRREHESVEDAVIREKLREQMVCELTGWRCIRLIWVDLARPAVTAERIRRILAGLPSAA